VDNSIAIIIVAVISALGGVLVALIQAARGENRRDHASVAAALTRLHNAMQKANIAVGRVEVKLDRHLLDHEKGDADGATGRHSD